MTIHERAGSAREQGVEIVEGAGTIERFERSPSGVCLVRSEEGVERRLEAPLAVVLALIGDRRQTAVPTRVGRRYPGLPCGSRERFQLVLRDLRTWSSHPTPTLIEAHVTRRSTT